MLMNERQDKTKQKLRKLSEPIPEFIQQVLSLYDVNIPVFFVPWGVILQFAEEDAVGHLWTDPLANKKPLGILIACDKSLEKYKNKNLALLMTVLHEIAHLKLHDAQMKFLKEAVERHKNLLEKEEGARSLHFLLKFGMENRIEKWVKSEWRKLRRFVNIRRTGWKRGLSFDQVRKLFKYDESEYYELFDTSIFRK